MPSNNPLHQTHDVYCHVCPHETCKHPRNRSRMIGDPHFGGLWHCEAHEEVDCGCPRGDWTERPKWWLDPETDRRLSTSTESRN